MKATIRQRFGDDAGMTLIELAIAAAILLIAVLGLFSLLITSTSMSIQAKQQNIAVNAANSYVEYVRSIPFDALGIVGAASPDPTGTLVPTSTVTVNAFTVTITPRVTWVADPIIASGTGQDYKRLDVIVNVSAASARSYTQRFVTYVRRPDSLQSGLGGGGEAPSINFVTGSKFLNAPPIYVSGDAEVVTAAAQIAAGSSATIKNVEFRLDGTLLRGAGGQDGSNAAWVNPGGTSGTFSFTWYTTSTEASTTGVPLFPDGQHVLRILVWDTAGGYRYRDTPVIIDNDPPTKILTPPVLARRDTAYKSTITWGPSYDGPDYLGSAREYANHYVMHVFRETWGYINRVGVYPPDLGDTESDLHPLLANLGSNPTTNTASVPTDPLSRYWVKIEAHSYTHRTAGVDASQGGTNMYTPFITRPSLTVTGTPTITTSGSGGNTVWTMTTSLEWQAPTFHYDSIVSPLTYRLERSESPTFSLIGWSQTFVGPYLLSTTNTKSVTSGSTPVRYYYRLVCTVKPTGEYSDGSTYTLYSNTVVMTPTVTGSGSNAVKSLPATIDWTAGTTP